MADCLTQEELGRHAKGSSDPTSIRRINDHLASCENCRSSFLKMSSEEMSGQFEAMSLDETQALNRKDSMTPEDTAPFRHWTLDAGAQPTKPSRDFLPQIEGYEIKRVIGRGGMGIVYEAIQQKLRRRVALKLLPAVAGSTNPQMITRFQREAAAAARLHHTNIIPVYDFGESRDGYYYAMELITGEALSSVIKRLAATDVPMTAHTRVTVLSEDDLPPSIVEASPTGEVPLVALAAREAASGRSAAGRLVPYYRLAAGWIADVADALHYAHQQEMVHRDIKPSNIMLSTDGRVIILDFGLVKAAGDESVTVSGAMIGTYRYMSPEQISGGRSLDARTDIYSLGASLYELLTFQPAFPSMDQQELTRHILTREPTAPRKIVPSVPPELQTICLKAMDKSPGSRYASMAELSADLRLYLEDQRIKARPVGLAGRAARWIRRHPAAAAICAIVLLLASAVTFSVWQRQKNRILTLRGHTRDGVAAWMAQDWKKAESEFNQALAIDPDYYFALVNFASARKDQFYRQQEPKLLVEANSMLERVLKDRPADTETWNSRGVILRNLGRLDQANSAHSRAVELDPKSIANWINLGVVQAMQGDLASAERSLASGTALAPPDVGPNPWHNLAVVQLQLNRNEAWDSLERALNQPWRAGEDLWKPSCYLLQCKLYLFQRDHMDANEALRSAIAADKMSEPAQHRSDQRPSERAMIGRIKRFLALSLLRNDRAPEAIDAARAALGFGDMASYCELIWGLAEARQGRMDEAHAHVQNAISQWPAGLAVAGGLHAPQSDYLARADEAILWIDSGEELRCLRGEIEGVQGFNDRENSGQPGE